MFLWTARRIVENSIEGKLRALDFVFSQDRCFGFARLGSAGRQTENVRCQAAHLINMLPALHSHLDVCKKQT